MAGNLPSLGGSPGNTGSPPAIFQQRLITQSQVFTATNDGDYWVTAIGAGGGGAAAAGGRGGGAGGLARKKVYLRVGDQLTITVGAGGAAGATGATGGTTTVTGPGISLSANGGGGGSDAAGAVGGAAAGGDSNVTGGGSANVNNSGGGAVGVYGVGIASTNSSGASAARQNFGVARRPLFGAAIQRLLEPLGGFSYSYAVSQDGGTERTFEAVYPLSGQGGVIPPFNGNTSGHGGMFSGSYIGFEGGIAGGGGGGATGALVSGRGGVGAVIIEWFGTSGAI